jgi:DNA-binding transcriptional LysR family regulator
MNDLQIEYFLAVAVNQSFTKASKLLYVSQPAISKQIAMLEKELGVKLFQRNNQKTEITEAGKLYYDFFINTRLKLKETMYAARTLGNKSINHINIGFMEGWDLSGIIPAFIQRSKAINEDLEISIDCCNIMELSSKLLSGELDMALAVKNGMLDIPELKFTDVFNMDKILIFSDRNPLARKEGLTLYDFKDEQFVAPWESMDKQVTQQLGDYCKPYGFVPNVTFVHNFEAMFTYVKNNLGVGFADEWTWSTYAPDIRSIPINNFDKISIITLKDNDNPTLQSVIDVLTIIIKSLSNS